MISLNIAVIELENHWDSVDGFCQFFENTEHKITVFTNTFIRNSLIHKNYFSSARWVVIPEKESKRKFIEKHLVEFNSCDCVFINTIHEQFGAYKDLNLKCLIVLRVHNAHKQFEPFQHVLIPINFFYLSKAFAYFFREIVGNRFNHYRKIINSLVDYFIFLEPAIREYVSNNLLVDEKKIGYALPIRPFAMRKKILHNRHDADVFNLTIIGTIDFRRRDYLTVITAIQKLIGLISQTKSIVALNLLGSSDSAYGKKIIDLAKKIQSKNFRLIYYENKVPTLDFETALQNTDILICPIEIRNISEIYLEIYGQSKFSGCMGDLISFPSAAIFPRGFEVDPDLMELVRVYSNDFELAMELKRFIDNPELMEQCKSSLINLFNQKYNREIILQEFEKFLQLGLINKSKLYEL